MTTTTTDPQATADVVSAAETLVQNLGAQFVETRDRLKELNREGDSRVTGSSTHISQRAKLDQEVTDLAMALEHSRADLKEAREAHQASLVAAYQDALPAILDRRHQLATEADKLITSLNTTLKRIMELSNQETKARDAAGQGGAGILRQDKIISGWVMSHIPALRSMRGPGSLTVYPICRGDLAAVYSPYTEEEA
jgi:chromosome segregation ATPase